MNDGDYAIRRFAEKAYNISHWSELHSSGHPALGVPDLLIGGIREFFRTIAEPTGHVASRWDLRLHQGETGG
ncbi:hypothetical protein [Nocardia sp. NPDC004604]|uniref:hypothetical protein n=1 Tax=Nocardia sp. NPDC004604 TaxID=3157013 RepID=UPI0033B2C844